MRALWNTTVLALVTSAATILLAVLVSWFVVRRTRAADGLSHYLATVSFLPQCVPTSSSAWRLFSFTFAFQFRCTAPMDHCSGDQASNSKQNRLRPPADAYSRDQQSEDGSPE